MEATCRRCEASVEMHYRSRVETCPRCGAFVWNRAKLPYHSTKISPLNSLTEIMKEFDRYKEVVPHYGMAQDSETGRRGVQFTYRLSSGNTIVAQLLVEPGLTDQEERQVWRTLVHWVKNTLLAITTGGLSTEEAFLGQTVGILKDGSTAPLGKLVEGRLGQVGMRSLPMFGVDVQVKALPYKEASEEQ